MDWKDKKIAEQAKKIETLEAENKALRAKNKELQSIIEKCIQRIAELERRLGVVTSGVAYQYAREVFPRASFLKLGMTYPLPRNLLRQNSSETGQDGVFAEDGSCRSRAVLP